MGRLWLMDGAIAAKAICVGSIAEPISGVPAELAAFDLATRLIDDVSESRSLALLPHPVS